MQTTWKPAILVKIWHKMKRLLRPEKKYFRPGSYEAVYQQQNAIQYRSYADLSKDIRHAMHKIPQDIDLVVGIPKSGMMPAMMIGLNLNIATTDLDRFLEGQIFSHGFGRTHGRQKTALSECKKILVVDDSIWSGRSLQNAKAKIAESSSMSNNRQVFYMAAYCTASNRDMVDIYCRECPMPRIFEWNVMHHSILKHACVDIDGVLCPDPTEQQNDDGEEYIRFVEETPPMYLPTHPIAMLVTNRLEKYRKSTEKWLSKHGVVYDSLVMLDFPTKQDRIRSEANNGVHKAKVFSNSDCFLFIESCHKQAMEIARISGKSVLSIEKQFMLNPEQLSPAVESEAE